jgi:hypothetical protein
MRHVRLKLGVTATLCAFAVAVTPALAHEFTANKAGKTKGISTTEQNFKFGPFKITCSETPGSTAAVARSKGKVVAGASKTYATTIKFTQCFTQAKIGAKSIKLRTHFLTPLAVEYHANGFVETGSETEEVEGSAVLAGGEVEIKTNVGITEERERSQCTILWPEQTLPLRAEKKPEGEFSEATYANETKPEPVGKKFPDGLQHSILITNAFKGIKFEFEGEPCEEWGKEETEEGGGGSYFGSFPAILSTGNFEFS